MTAVSFWLERSYMKKKESKIVVITGASSGIGKGLKQLFERDGHTVVGLSRGDCGKEWRKCDVTDFEQVKSTIDAVGMQYGKIDILINNAGVGISGALELTTDDDYKKIMSTDVDGVFNVCRAAVKYIPAGGRIVNISSVCALFALPYRSLYCAAKAAVNMMSFGLRMELKNSGITVVTVCPGEIKTGFTSARIKNYATNDRYGDSIKLSAKHIDDKEEKRMSCLRASKKIYKIAARKKGAMYIVGAKYRMLYFLSKIFPVGAMLSGTGRFMIKRK